MAHVSEEMIEAFEADGVILLKNVFPESWLDRLAAGSELLELRALGGSIGEAVFWERSRCWPTFGRSPHSPMSERTLPARNF